MEDINLNLKSNVITESKICSVCHNKKLLDSEFTKLKKSKDGYDSRCRSCKKIQSTHYYNKNKEKILNQKKLYYKDNLTSILEEKKLYRNENRQKVRNSYNEFYSKNKEKVQVKQKIYRKNNKEKIRLKDSNYVKRRKKIDPLFKAIKNIRSRLNKLIKFKKFKKGKSYSSYIGCDNEFLLDYISKLFQPGMTWNNYGLWHIDHIIPLSSARNIEKLYELSHYSNLRPLWEEDNLKKSDKII